MSEEEKIFSVTHFWEDETRTYYEGKPFTGVCVDYYQNGQLNKMFGHNLTVLPQPNARLKSENRLEVLQSYFGLCNQ